MIFDLFGNLLLRCLTIRRKMGSVIIYRLPLSEATFFSWGTRAQHLTLSVCVMCGVPWMDAML